MKKVTIQLPVENSVGGESPSSNQGTSAVRRDMQALIRAMAFFQRRMHPTQPPHQLELDCRLPAGHVIGFRAVKR